MRLEKRKLFILLRDSIIDGLLSWIIRIDVIIITEWAQEVECFLDSDHVIRGGLVKFNCDFGIWMMIDRKFLTLNRLGLFQFRRSGLGSSLELGKVLALAKTLEMCLNFGGRSVVCFRV